MKKKIIIVIIISLLIVFGIGVALLWYLSGGILGEIFFDIPAKPKVKQAEFPFELVYEYDNKQFTISETIVCEYEGISFVLDGGNHREWNCYIANSDSDGFYYLDEEKYPTLHICIPLDGEYYMGAPDANPEFAKPYIFFIDESTGTTYYEQDLTDVVGVRIISWESAKPLKGNIKGKK